MGRLDLSAPVSAWLEEFSSGPLSQVSWEDLLAHRAGLEAWAPLYVEREIWELTKGEWEEGRA